MAKHIHVHFGRKPTADAEDGKWVTINGTHVMIGKGGKIVKGPAALAGKTQSEAHTHAAKEHEKAHKEAADRGDGAQAMKHGAAADAHKLAAKAHGEALPNADKHSAKAEAAHSATKTVTNTKPKPAAHEKLHQEAGGKVTQMGSKAHNDEHARLMGMYDKAGADWERSAINRKIEHNATSAGEHAATKAENKARELSAAAHKSGDNRDHDAAHRATKHAAHMLSNHGGVGASKKAEELHAIGKGHEAAMKASQKPTPSNGSPAGSGGKPGPTTAHTPPTAGEHAHNGVDSLKTTDPAKANAHKDALHKDLVGKGFKHTGTEGDHTQPGKGEVKRYTHADGSSAIVSHKTDNLTKKHQVSSYINTQNKGKKPTAMEAAQARAAASGRQGEAGVKAAKQAHMDKAQEHHHLGNTASELKQREAHKAAATAQKDAHDAHGAPGYMAKAKAAEDASAAANKLGFKPPGEKTGPSGPGKPGTPGNLHDPSKKAATVLAAAKQAKEAAAGKAPAGASSAPAPAPEKKSITRQAHEDAAASHKAKANTWRNPAHGQHEEGAEEAAKMHEEAAAHHEHMAQNEGKDHSARGAQLRTLKQKIAAHESAIEMGQVKPKPGAGKPGATTPPGKAPSSPGKASGGTRSGGKGPDSVTQATDAVKGLTKLIKKTEQEADPNPKKKD